MRLCAFGESTVNGTGDPQHLGWVGRALAGRRDATLYNLGIRREASDELAARWKGEALLRWTEAEPMRLVFGFGLNDCILEAGRPRVSPEQAEANARMILGEAGRMCPTLMVGPPPPADSGLRERAGALNVRLAQASASVGAPYVDVFDALLADPLWMEEIASWDGAHPGGEGYEHMAAIVTAHPAWTALLSPTT